MIDIAVVMSCFNRREQTLDCLSKLQLAASHAKAELTIYLFDDGSSDNTADSVRATFSNVEIIAGDGSFFWNRGMYRAFEKAQQRGHSYYLWLNDDTKVFPDSLSVLLSDSMRCSDSNQGVIIAGAVSDAQTGEATYGGGIRPSPSIRPFYYQLANPNGLSQAISTMNGNCVLIDQNAVNKVGNLDWTFEHGMGDIDYALRATKAKVGVYLSSKYIAHCSRNPIKNTIWDSSANLSQRMNFAFSRKGLPVRSWSRLCSQHAGLIWPVHFVWGYLRILKGAVK